VNLLRYLIPLLALHIGATCGAERKLPVFTDVTEKSGITAKHSYGDFDLSNIVEGTGGGAMFFDYDGDGGQGVSSMGPAVGDVDRNGWLDIYIPDMGYGCLLINRKDYFEDRTEPANLAVVCGQYTGWGGILFDYDCDGWLDIFVANGNAHHEYTEEDVIMRNDGKGNFADVANKSGSYFRKKYVGRGATYGDYDNDGDLDILIVNLNDKPRLLRNDGGNANNWLIVEAREAVGASDAIGARVTVTTGSLIQIRDLIPVTGYLSQADPRCHFGLGDATKADTVEIRWPDKKVTKLTNIDADQILKVIQEP